MADTPLDKDVVAAGVIAAKKYAANITFMGVHVSSAITDEEYNDLVTAVIKAVDDYRNAVQI